MPTTSNFGWTTPADTDLVKDGAAAIRTLGNGVDSSFVDLKGGTTGQVLSKASNTDLDFTWVAQDDSNAIQNAIVDAKGDLISATAADTPARLAVGANGTVLTADSAEATGLKWAAPAAGGKVLQVVYGSSSTATAITTEAYADTSLSASITPSAATSKVLIMVAQVSRTTRGAQGTFSGIRLLRDSTAILTPSPSEEEQFGSTVTGDTGTNTLHAVIAMDYLDSPNTTSSITYKTQGAVFVANSGQTYTAQYNSAVSTIILIEIGA